MIRCFQFLTSVWLLLWPLAAQAQDVVVFAAASLKPPLDAVISAWLVENDPVAVSYGGSGAMAQQILRGAPADIYLSAHSDWVDVVEDAGRIDPGGRVDLLGNALVLIGPAGSAAARLEDLARLPFDRLAMGQTRGVPAGQYGRAALEAAGLWGEVAPRVVEVENVQAVVRLVQLGEVDFGVVYASDALAANGVDVVLSFDPATHDPILYSAALLVPTPEAEALFRHLQSDAARAVFEDFGFRWVPGR